MSRNLGRFPVDIQRVDLLHRGILKRARVTQLDLAGETGIVVVNADLESCAWGLGFGSEG